MIKYYILASGSSGNSTALVNDDGKILLIDCGLSIVETKKRLANVGLDFENIKKVLITHLHSDHTQSLKAMENDMVYINSITEMNDYHQFEYYQHLNLLGFDIYTLPASHDSPGTTGFLIEYNGEKMLFLTDTGYVHENIQKLINNCDIYCIESNHDPRLLMISKRPLNVKNRTISAMGHLSNADCAYVLGNVMGPRTKEVVFLHRSREANTEEMILETFYSTMKKMNVDVSTLKVKIAKQNEVVSYKD